MNINIPTIYFLPIIFFLWRNVGSFQHLSSNLYLKVTLILLRYDFVYAPNSISGPEVDQEVYLSCQMAA